MTEPGGFTNMGMVASLVCGTPDTEGIAKQALNQLGKSMETFSLKALSFLNEEFSDDAMNFGPFCARVLLENGCAAILGRVDCFRLLYLSEFQAQSTYKLEIRAKSSFSWTG